MIDLADVEAIRGALIQLCRNPAMRITGRALDTANRWVPYSVRHPQTAMLFTDAGAWDFIADCIQGCCDLKCIGPTTTHADYAYYLLENDGGGRRIYMKIAVRPPLRKVIGLSFHYEDPR